MFLDCWKMLINLCLPVRLEGQFDPVLHSAFVEPELPKSYPSLDILKCVNVDGTKYLLFVVPPRQIGWWKVTFHPSPLFHGQ